VREDVLHGFLKNKAFFKATHLQSGRDAPRELSQLVIEQREACTNTGISAVPSTFAKIIVGQGHLDVEIEQAVQVIGRYGSMKVFVGYVQPGLRWSAFQ